MVSRGPRHTVGGFEDAGYSSRKEEIRDKARDIFLQHGYRKTSLEDIGKACGLVKGALYHYFGSKEELFAEVVKSESASLLQKMRAAVDDANEPKEKIIAMIRTRFRFISHYLIGKGVSAEMIELLPLAAKVRQTYFQEEAKILQDILEKGRQRGVFKPNDSKTLPLLMISALRGIETYFAEIRDVAAQEKGMDEILNVMMNGICR